MKKIFNIKFKKFIFFIFFTFIFINILLFLNFTLSSYCFGEPKIVSKLNSAFEDIESWLIKLSTPAAAVAVGTGVFMRKFSFGDEEKIRTGKKIIKGSLFSYAFILAIDLILSAIKSLISSEVFLEENNITQIIIDTINTILGNLFGSIDNNLYSILDDISFISSDILDDKNFENIFGTSASNGILLIANSLLLGIILYFSISYLLSHFTYSQIENPKSFILKLIIYGICMNFSYFLISQFIDIFSNISLAIRNIGEILFKKNICFSELILYINNHISINTSSLDFFSLDGIIKGTLSISLLNLVLSYSFRYILIKVFVLLTPFAFLSNCLSSTSWFFKSWFKNLFSLLFIQIIISIILLLLFSIDYSSNLFSKFVYIGGMYALIKSNSFVRDFIGGVSTTFSQNVNNFSKFLK